MNTSLKAHRIGRILLIAALSAAFGLAIDPHRATSQYVRDHWGSEQGFPRGSVYAISQTNDGYLWIGTEVGLVRFDGLHFTQILDQSKTPLISVVGLAADKDGSLWIRLRDTTLFRYKDGVIEKLFRDPTSNMTISAVARGNDGGLLAVRSQLGAFTYRGDRALHMIAKATGIPRTPITAVTQLGNGDVWMGTRGFGLVRLSGGQTETFKEGLPDPKINSLLADGPGQVWIGTDNGVARWDGSKVTSEGIPPELKRSQILSLAKDRDGNLWISTDAGALMRLNQDGVAAVGPGKGEPGYALTTLFEDREGSLWFGGANGLERLRDSAFVTYSAPEGLRADGSNPIFVDAEDRLWFPPVDGGLSWMKDGRHGDVNNDGLDKDVVYSIAGGEDEIWLARQRGGLTRLRTTPSGFESKTYTKTDGLAQNSVYSVYRAQSGVVWAGTLSGGVSKVDRGVFTTYTIRDGLASNTVASITETADGTMWFATPVALSALSNGKWRVFTTGEGLPAANVNCLLEDSGKVLWAGTTRGLALYKSGRFVVPASAPASLREQILGLAEDRSGWLWIATSNHVLRVKRDKLMQGTLVEADVREYGYADGLRGLEGVKRHRSVVTDSKGRIWMSLNHGISVADPARLTASSAKAIPQIQTISVDDVVIPVNGQIHIPARPQRIAIGFTGLSLSFPERVRFKYRLDNYDQDWSAPTNKPAAEYTKLDSGPYRLHVRASNPDGEWSDSEASIAFNVEPAFWQTWWFRAAVILAMALTTIAFYRLRLRQLTSDLNMRFEERLAERTRIAQELHDTLLQGFLSASMQVHVAAARLPPDSDVKPALERAQELMRQVIEEGRNAVRGLRASRSASLDLEEAFSRIQEELPLEDHAGDPVDFRVISEGAHRVPLHPIVRDEVFRIGREALRNAFRHARAKHIEIELIYSASQFRVVVRDDGSGVDTETLLTGRDGHYGLVGMRERAERIGAELRLFSNPKAGTEVELTIPGPVAFRSDTNNLESTR